MSEVLTVAGYQVILILFLAGLTQRLSRKRDHDREFDGFYFLRWSAGLAVGSQVGFTVLVSIIFHSRHSLAVSLTALVAIPMGMILTMWLQWSFFRRYNRISNLIARLEKMPPEERANVLKNLPPPIFSQLPGDYRFVSQEK
jgi:hypothetical protein